MMLQDGDWPVFGWDGGMEENSWQLAALSWQLALNANCQLQTAAFL